jgi:SprT protein
MTQNELQAKIEEEAKLWYALAQDHYKVEMPELKIDFSLRGKVAGQAWTNDFKLRFNMHLAMGNQEHFLKTTVPHEVAHIVADYVYKRRCNHGVYWQSVMNTFNVPASRCHSYDTTGISTGLKKFSYACENCGNKFGVGAKVHGKIQAGAGYRCRCSRTKGILKFIPD